MPKTRNYQTVNISHQTWNVLHELSEASGIPITSLLNQMLIEHLPAMRERIRIFVDGS